MKSVITVKTMIEKYVAYGLDSDTWEMFYKMRCHNLISYETWEEFYNTCKGWQFDNCECTAIVDTENEDRVVYKMDENGFFKNVK